MAFVEVLSVQRISRPSILPALVATVAVAVIVVMSFPLSVPAVILGALAGGITLAVSSREPRHRALAVGLIGAAVGLLLASVHLYLSLVAV